VNDQKDQNHRAQDSHISGRPGTVCACFRSGIVNWPSTFVLSTKNCRVNDMNQDKREIPDRNNLNQRVVGHGLCINVKGFAIVRNEQL
jgi:hypothetical protein